MNSPYPDNMGYAEWDPKVDPLVTPFVYMVVGLACAFTSPEDYYSRRSEQQYMEGEKRLFHRALRKVYERHGWEAVSSAVDAAQAALALGPRTDQYAERSDRIMWILMECADL